jgi:hypothetical protein
MRKIILASTLLLITIACGDPGESSRSSSAAGLKPDRHRGSPSPVETIPSTGPVPPGCVRTEGESLGRNITLDVGGRTVEFTNWTSKEGKSNGEYVGFSFVASGPVSYAVKAGRETFWGATNAWTHPAGLSGSAAHAISNITFCESPSDGGTDPAETDAGNPDGGECIDIEGSCNPTDGSDAGTPDGGECIDIEGSCAQMGERGDSCAQDPCYSGQCVDNTCAGGGAGDSCRSINDCKPEHICEEQQHTCVVII